MTTNDLKHDIEKKIFKYLLQDKLYLSIADSVLHSKFFSPEDKNVYRLIILYYHEQADVLKPSASRDIFQSSIYSQLTEKDWKTYESLVTDDTIDIDNTEADLKSSIEILKNLYKKEELITIAAKIVEDSTNKDLSADDIKQLNEYVINKASALDSNETDVRKSGSIFESAEEQFNNYTYLYNNPDSVEYIPTGFNMIDNVEGGFRRSELVYVIGRKGTGKSILLLNLAYNACKAKKNILLFSLEIAKEDYERRLAACACSVPSNGLKKGNLSDEDYNRYKSYINNLKKGMSIDNQELGEFVIIDIPAQCKPAFIESQLILEQRKRQIKFDVVVVDYAGIMQPDVFVPEKRHQQGSIALSLKRLARKYDCVVLSAAQMSRQGRNDINQKGGHADSAHVAESDQVADHIDWGIAIKLNDGESQYGILESFKTRDAAPFSFPFKKNYAMMQMLPAKLSDNEPADPAGYNWGKNAYMNQQLV